MSLSSVRRASSKRLALSLMRKRTRRASTSEGSMPSARSISARARSRSLSASPCTSAARIKRRRRSDGSAVSSASASSARASCLGSPARTALRCSARMAVRRPGSSARILSSSSMARAGWPSSSSQMPAIFSRRPTRRGRSDSACAACAYSSIRARTPRPSVSGSRAGGASSAESASKMVALPGSTAQPARRWAMASSRRRRCRSAMSEARISAAIRTRTGRLALASATQVRTRSS